MDCYKVKELLISDYIDGEADEKTKEEVKNHLSNCSDCKSFEQSVIREVTEPFKNAQMLTPPETVWLGIKRQIERKPAGLFEKITDLFNVKRLVYAASFAVVIVFGAMFTYRMLGSKPVLGEYVETQMDFLSELENENGGYEGLGTIMEEYFL